MWASSYALDYHMPGMDGLETAAAVMGAGLRPVREIPSTARTARVTEAVDERELRILVAEDNEDNRVLIQAYLKNAPVDLTLAHNGAEAVEHFESSQTATST